MVKLLVHPFATSLVVGLNLGNGFNLESCYLFLGNSWDQLLKGFSLDTDLNLILLSLIQAKLVVFELTDLTKQIILIFGCLY